MALDRREFISSIGASVMLGSSSLAFAQAAGQRRLERIGVQLYTARADMEKDVEGTLARIAAVGYREVEFAGYFGKTPPQIRQMLDRHGLTSPSAHIDLATISTKLPQVIDDSRAIGHQFIVMPYLDDTARAEPDIYKRVADTLNTAGAEARKAGIQIAYHNHNFEFVATSGKSGFETLMELCDPSLVKVELDLCWATSANQDPVALFRRYPGRFPMVHVKGLRRKPAAGAAAPISEVLPDVTEVGANGDVIDWAAIFSQASVGGVQHYFVEHDQPADALASLQTSYRYLEALRF